MPMLPFFIAFYKAKEKAVAKEIALNDTVEKNTQMKLGPIRNDFIVKMDAPVEEFCSNFYFREVLFLKTKKMLENMNKLVEGVLEEFCVRANTQLKANNPENLANAIILKSLRKNIPTVAEFIDLARGRINCDFKEQMELVVEALTHLGKACGYQVRRLDPRRPLNGKPGMFGYPRIHLLIDDFEWQIGPQAVTDLFEKLGISVPEDKSLWDGMKGNLHYIGFKYFIDILLLAKTDECYQKIVETIDIQGFLNKLDLVTANAGYYGVLYSKLPQEIDKLHREASQIIKAIIKLLQKERQQDLPTGKYMISRMMAREREALGLELSFPKCVMAKK